MPRTDIRVQLHNHLQIHSLLVVPLHVPLKILLTLVINLCCFYACSCNSRTLQLLGVSQEELGQLCAASTAFIAHVINQVRGRALSLRGLTVSASTSACV